MAPRSSWVLSLVALLGGLLRTTWIDEVSLCYDESCAIKIAMMPLAEMFRAIAVDAHPPLYYVLLKCWCSVFGYTSFAARLLSCVAGCLAIPAAYVASQRVFEGAACRERVRDGSVGAMFAAVVVAFLPFHLELSFQARPYSIMGLLSILAVSELACLQNGKSRSGCGVRIATLIWLLSMLHYQALFFSFALALTAGACVLSAPPWKRAEILPQFLAPRFLAASAFFELSWAAWLPHFLFQLGRANSQLWIPELTAANILGSLADVLVGGEYSSANAWWVLVPASLILVLLRFGRAGIGVSLMVLLIAPIFQIAAMLVYSCLVRSVWETRYLVVATGPFIVVFSGVVGVVTPQRRRTVLVLLAFAYSLFVGFHLESRRHFATNSGVRKLCVLIADSADAECDVYTRSPYLFPTLCVYLSGSAQVSLVCDLDPSLSVNYGSSVRERDLVSSAEFASLRSEGTCWIVDGVSDRPDESGVFQVKVQEAFRIDQTVVATVHGPRLGR